MMKADEFLDGGSSKSADAFLEDAPAPAKRDPLVEKMAQVEAGKKARAAAEPGAAEYLINRLKKGVAGFMGIPGDVVDFARSGFAPHPAAGSVNDMAKGFAETEGGAATGVSRARRPNTNVNFRPTDSFIKTSKGYQEAFGVKDMQTSNDALRYAGGVAEMVGAGGPFASVMRAGSIPSLLTSAAGSGIGLEAGGDIAEGLGIDRQTGEAVGAFAGGFIPAVSGAATSKAVDMAKGRFSKGSQIAKAEREALNEVRAHVDEVPASGINLERSQRVADEFKAEGVDFTPSLPARTNSPGLLAIEKNLITDNPSALNRAAKNAEDLQLQIADFIDAKFPVTKAESAVKRVQNFMKMGDQKLTAMKTAVDEALDGMITRFSGQPNDFNGAKLRDLFMKQKMVYRGIRDQKYQDVYKTARELGVTDNIDDVVKYVDDTLKADLNAFNQADIPSVFREVKTKFVKEQPELTGRSIDPDLLAEATKAKPADVSFEELHSLYKRTNSDLAVLRGSADLNAPTKIRLLENVKSMLKGKIDAYQEGAFGPVADKLKAANAFYESEYLPRFKQGFGGEISAKYATGEYRTPDQLVTSLITKSNNTQAAKDFKTLFDDVPEAWNALRDGYMDKLFREGGVINKDGRIAQPAMERFLRQHEPTLKEFPQIKADIQRLASDNAALLERQGRVMAQQKELHAAELYKMFNGGDVAQILDNAITDPKAMRLLANQARGSTERAQAFARSIADRVTMADDPVKFFRTNEEAIRNGLAPLGAEHWKNMRTVVDALDISSRTQIPTTVPRQSIVPDSIAERLGSSPRAIIAHVINVERGRSGVVQEGGAFLGRFFDKLRRDHKAVVLESIFYDPDTSKVMANLGKNPASEKARSDFMAQMVKLGVQTEVAGQE